MNAIQYQTAVCNKCFMKNERFRQLPFKVGTIKSGFELGSVALGYQYAQI